MINPKRVLNPRIIDFSRVDEPCFEGKSLQTTVSVANFLSFPHIGTRYLDETQ